MGRFRNRHAGSGRYVSADVAAANPAETVTEAVKLVDLDLVARRMYAFEIDDGLPWDELSQNTRDKYRALARVSWEAIKDG